jgi:hypothetical protein
MKLGRFLGLACAGLLLVSVAGPAWAQATRTWVSGVGDDANPCSRTAPCLTFAAAIAKTAASGEIDTLDPGNFGAVTITKAITIANDSTGTAGILALGTDAIVINAGPNDPVILRGLALNGFNPAGSPGLNGVNLLQAGSLVIENCKIYNFQQNGVNYTPDSTSALSIVDSVIFDNGSNGGPLGNFGDILIQGQGTGVTITASLDRVQILNGFKPGLRIDASETTGTTNVAIRDSSIQGNGGTGLAAQTTAPDNGVVTMTVSNSTVSGNLGFGVHSTGTNASTFMSGTTVIGNAAGVGTTSSNLVSLGNNAIVGNTTNGAPTSTTPLH